MLASKLLDDVAEVTKRPDARARSLLALNTLITDIVTNADYTQDLVEIQASNPTPTSNYGVIPLGALPVRKIAYVTVADRPILPVSPRQALDAAGKQMVNVYYRSGSNLIVHAANEFSTLQLGYFSAPSYLTETDTHWLLDMYPALLLNGVVSRTFMATGDDTSSAFYERVYLQLRSQIRRQDLGDE